MTPEEELQQLRAELLARAQAAVPFRWQAVIALVCILLAAATVAGAYWWIKHDHAVLMTQEQIKSTEELRKALGVSQATADQLRKEMAKASAGYTPPTIHYTIAAPTVDRAAQIETARINAGTSPANKVEADKTVVTPNMEKQKVDVFRITLDRRWEAGGGLIWAGNVIYPVGAVQYNPTKDTAIEVLGGPGAGAVLFKGRFNLPAWFGGGSTTEKVPDEKIREPPVKKGKKDTTK